MMKKKLLFLLALILCFIGYAQAPANDECDNPEPIALTTTDLTNVITDTSLATQSLISSCENQNQTWLDTWYHFTMPVDGNVRITAVDIFDNFTLYANCNDAMLPVPVEIDCSNGATYFYELTATTNYILRYANRDIYAGLKDFNIQAFATVTNDECANPVTILVETENAINVETNTVGATQSLISSCENQNQTWLDTWYQFTMPVNGNVRITAVDIFDNFTLYANCNDAMLPVPVEIDCTNGATYFYELTATTNYILRYANRDVYAGLKDFNIQAFATVGNDECANPVTILVETENAINVETNTVGATQSLISSCENQNQTWLDTWYQFTMPVNGNIGITEVDIFDNLTLYANCDDVMLPVPVEISCSNGSTYFYNLTATTNYILRYANRDVYAGLKDFNIQAFASISNDSCASAELIQVANLGDCTSEQVTIDVRGGGLATVLGSCMNTSFNWHEAWYTFEAPLTGNISLNAGNIFNNFTVYDACSGNEIACFNSDGIIPVVFGNTYVLQVLMRDNYAGTQTFCLEGAPEVATGTVGVCENLPDVTISAAQNNTNSWVPILDANGNIAAAINANGNDLGLVTTTLYIDMLDTRSSGSQAYSRREVSITPTAQPTTNVNIRIYSLQDEVTDLIAVDSNLNYYFNLKTMRVDGTGCTSGYASGGAFINSSTALYGSDYYTSLSTNSFSVFYPTSTNLDTTLSLESLDTILAVKVFPTVSTGIFNIKSECILNQTKLSVLDINGRLILSSEVDLGSSPIQINLEKASKGLYFLKLENNGSIKTQKIILK